MYFGGNSGGTVDSHARNMVGQLDQRLREQQQQIETLQRQVLELQVKLADTTEALDRVDGVT